MRTLKTLNSPTKALLVLLIPCIYLLILNKSLWFVLWLVFGVTVKDYANSGLIAVLNIIVAIYFILETVVFLYSKPKRNEY